MNDEDTLFPSAPDVHNAFETSKDSAPEEAQQVEEEPEEKTYDKPELNLDPPSPVPGGGMGGLVVFADVQTEILVQSESKQPEHTKLSPEKTAEEKSQNSNDILNRASVMLNEDWQKATGLDADPTEGIES